MRRYNILLNISLIILLVLAIMAVTVDKLLKVILIAGIFSAIASFVYLLLGAPDVALAEAIIGSTLSTIILLVALKRCKLFTVYFITADPTNRDTIKLTNAVERALKGHEIEPHIVYANETAKQIQNTQSYDIIVERFGNSVTIYGKEHSFNMKIVLEQLKTENLGFEVSVVDDIEIRKYRYKGDSR